MIHRTIATAKHTIHASSFYNDVDIGRFLVGAHIGCIAATKEIFDGVFAIVYMHRRTSGHSSRRSLIGSIVGQIATAKHLFKSIFLFIGIRQQQGRGPTAYGCFWSLVCVRMFRVDHMHFDITVGRTTMVVGAKHATEDGGTFIILTHLVVIADIQFHIALRIITVTTKISVGSAAIHIALDGATKDIDLGIAIHTAGQMVGCPQVIAQIIRGVVYNGRGHTVHEHGCAIEDGVMAAVAAAIHAAKVVSVSTGATHVGKGANGTSVDNHTRIARHGTLLRTAEHTALDGATIDDDLSHP